uniref:Uncharacterized protein n=1 Tax=Phage sp. ctvTz5 TaxID=2826754 RepID=A0A8S5QR84_9VIRU|nr:MAG TPA: hypothetical protein [Phage sp. ctvTz5]
MRVRLPRWLLPVNLYTEKRSLLISFHSNQQKRDWSWMHQNPVNNKL